MGIRAEAQPDALGPQPSACRLNRQVHERAPGHVAKVGGLEPAALVRDRRRLDRELGRREQTVDAISGGFRDQQIFVRVHFRGLMRPCRASEAYLARPAPAQPRGLWMSSLPVRGAWISCPGFSVAFARPVSSMLASTMASATVVRFMTSSSS